MIEWFDDLVLGMRFKSTDKQVTREEIKRFASEFDPQPYHLDETAAERTPLKGLAASGWHTAAIAMRLAVEVRPFGPHPLLGLGVDDLRWLAPRTPRRCDPHRRRGGQAHTIKDEAARSRAGQMDGVQSTQRPRLHLHSDRRGAASPERIDRTLDM
jgi:MaoC like domain